MHEDTSLDQDATDFRVGTLVPVFQGVTNESIATSIRSARRRIVFAAPGASKMIANALIEMHRVEGVSISIILDSDEASYQLGFGEPAGFALLHEFAESRSVRLQRQPGIRIITKDVSWESTRDSEFADALRDAFPAEELEGWFEEFMAAREREPVPESGPRNVVMSAVIPVI